MDDQEEQPPQARGEATGGSWGWVLGCGLWGLTPLAIGEVISQFFAYDTANILKLTVVIALPAALSGWILGAVQGWWLRDRGWPISRWMHLTALGSVLGALVVYGLSAIILLAVPPPSEALGSLLDVFVSRNFFFQQGLLPILFGAVKGLAIGVAQAQGLRTQHLPSKHWIGVSVLAFTLMAGGSQVMTQILGRLGLYHGGFALGSLAVSGFEGLVYGALTLPIMRQILRSPRLTSTPD